MAAELRASRSGLRALGVAGLVAFCVLALAEPALAETRPQYGQRARGSLMEEPLEIDPLRAQTHTDLTLASLFFDTLYREREGKIVAHLAVALPDAVDPLKVRIPLRPQVRFHDGRLLTAGDVAASLERVRKSKHGHLLETVKAIEVGEGELVLHLHRADPLLARRLADLHASITARGRAPAWRRLNGTGAYRLDKRLGRRRELHLRAHDEHFGGRVYLDELVLRWFHDARGEARSYERGGAELSMRGAIAFAGHRPKYRTLAKLSQSTVLAFVGFGKKSAIASEIEFRRALSAAIGRSGMRQIFSGARVSPTRQLLPRTRGVPAPRLPADKKRAAQLMRTLSQRYAELEAGTLALELIVNKSRPDDATIAGRVAAALFAFGIKTRIVELSASAFRRRAHAGHCDLYIGQLALGAGPGEVQIRSAFILGGQKKQARDLAGSSVAAMERRFAARLPIVPLFHRGIRLHHRNDLHGVDFGKGVRVLFENLFFAGRPVKN